MDRSARRWLRKHPWVGNPTPPRLPSGETDEREELEEHRLGGHRVLTGFEQMAHDLIKMVPPNESRTIMERAMSVLIERALGQMKPRQADLLRRVYWERATQKQIAADLGCSQQAVSQRIDAAKGAFKRALMAGINDDLEPEAL